MTALQIKSPYEYFPDPDIGRPIFNGQIFIGVADKDPELAENQITVLKTTESGEYIPIQQPVKTSSGGITLDENGNYISISTDGIAVYSIKVLNKQGAQVYYEPFAKSYAIGDDFEPTLLPRYIGDGVTTVFSAGASEGITDVNFFISLSGVTQRPGTDFTINSDGDVVFTEAPPVGVFVDILFFDSILFTSPNDASKSTVTSRNSGEKKQLQDWVVDIESNDTGKIVSPEAKQLKTNITYIGGAMRQNRHTPVASIVRDGTTVTVVKNNHQYETLARIYIEGAVQEDYNGMHQITVIDANTFTFEINTTPDTPATGSLKSRWPRRWDWIKDDAHEPVGVDDSSFLLVEKEGYILELPFTNPVNKIVSFNVGPDETYAGVFNSALGASVTLTSANVQMATSRTLAFTALDWNSSESKWDTIVYGTQQGGSYPGFSKLLIDIQSITISDVGIVTVVHDYLLGNSYSITPVSNINALYPPEVPVILGVTNTTFQFRIWSEQNNAYLTKSQFTSESTRFNFTKTFTGKQRLDGASGDADRIGLEFGNFWFTGAMLNEVE